MILVIDDDDLRRRSISRLLKASLGGTVDSASTYEDAMYKLSSNTYNLVSIDYDLGQALNGGDIAREIVRLNISIPDVRVHSSCSSGAYEIVSILETGNIKNKLFDSIKVTGLV